VPGLRLLLVGCEDSGLDGWFVVERKSGGLKFLVF
jgi:hypothetical protein